MNIQKQIYMKSTRLHLKYKTYSTEKQVEITSRRFRDFPKKSSLPKQKSKQECISNHSGEANNERQKK